MITDLLINILNYVDINKKLTATEKYIYKYINFNKTYSGLFNNNINFVKKNKICKYGCLNLLKEMVENHY